jgi:hypothetical protein
MNYEDRELPTRPDTPSATARRCLHCGRVYGEHRPIRPRPAWPSKCLGLRRNFQPEDHSDGDQTR